MTVPSRFHPLQDSFERLSRLLRKSNYPPSVLDVEGCLLGRSHALLPPLRHLLFEVSKSAAADFAEKYGLAPTNSDLKLVEITLKILRFEFNLLPPISAPQFLASGFAQKKLETLCLLADRIKMGKIRKPVRIVEDAQAVPPQPQTIPEEFPNETSHETSVSVENQTNQLEEILACVEALTSRFAVFEEKLETVTARVTLLEMGGKIKLAEETPRDGESAMTRVAEKIKDTEELLQRLSLKKLNASGA